MENRKDFHHDDLLDRAVDAVLRDPVPDELSPDRLDQLAAVVRRAADQPYPVTLIERMKNMRPRTRIAVAAAVVIALLGLLSWLVPGGGVAVAFADVAEALNGVRSATWKTTSVVTFKPVGEKQEKTVTRTASCMFLTPLHEREETTEDGGKSIRIADGQKDKMIVLNPATKTAMVMNAKNVPPGEHFGGTTFQGFRELVADAQSGKGAEVERLGVKTIDGRSAEGFGVQHGVVAFKIWADPKTLLPIRVESEFADAATGNRSSTVMTDFVVNVPLDESLFSVDVPPGYTIHRTMEVDASKPLTFLADALKMAAKYNDGVFPPTLRGEQGIDGIMKRSAETLAKTMAENRDKVSPETLKQDAQEFRDAAMNLAAAMASVAAMPPDTWHYAGKNVKLGTPNRPIFWVNLKKLGGRCMVIYADLSVKTVSAEETLSFPQAEGSPKPPGTRNEPLRQPTTTPAD
jgi:outer membrane lipoprotein-sorting protein